MAISTGLREVLASGAMEKTGAGPVEFRQALRHLASGVSVITTGRKPFRTGFTATSVSSLSPSRRG